MEEAEGRLFTWARGQNAGASSEMRDLLGELGSLKGKA